MGRSSWFGDWGVAFHFFQWRSWLVNWWRGRDSAWAPGGQLAWLSQWTWPFGNHFAANITLQFGTQAWATPRINSRSVKENGLIRGWPCSFGPLLDPSLGQGPLQLAWSSTRFVPARTGGFLVSGWFDWDSWGNVPYGIGPLIPVPYGATAVLADCPSGTGRSATCGPGWACCQSLGRRRRRFGCRISATCGFAISCACLVACVITTFRFSWQVRCWAAIAICCCLVNPLMICRCTGANSSTNYTRPKIRDTAPALIGAKSTVIGARCL